MDIVEERISVPVLLIGFNRPEVIRKTFAFIREAKPINLYIAIDGPRSQNHGEDVLVSEVKKIVANVDWNCDVKYKYNDKNKGAEVTISKAISWVLESEEYVIVLEDDIVAPLSFFKFVQEMLIRYKDEPKVFSVSGCNWTPTQFPNHEDYLFAFYGHSWGWGIWKRSFDKFDLNVEVPDEHIKTLFLRTFCNSKAEIRYYKKKFSKMKKRGAGNNTWDICLHYIKRVEEGLTIVPRVNLTTNIGTHGLHARGKTENHFRPYDENFKVKVHPKKIERNVEYDRHHFKTFIGKRKPMILRVKKRIKRLFSS
jgi:glycosyltransferase involved in cell wall biosynthesis